MSYNRRQFLLNSATASAGLGLLFSRTFARQTGKTRLILLGTRGGPRVSELRRANPSTLILVDDVPFVIDCGYGVTRQFLSAGIALNRLRYIFITHHHSDHNLEYGPLLYNAWIAGVAGKVEAYGPPGTRKMTQDFFSYQKFDIDTRIIDEGREDLRKIVFAHDVAKSGVVLDTGTVKVTARRVRHPPIEHAFAFRFDTPDRSIVISGDTAYSPELVELAKGADVLVHEVMYVPALEPLLKRAAYATKLRAHLLASHTVPEDVGRVAAEAGVKTLVMSHFVPGDDLTITDEQWTEDARKHFKGRIIVGRDLMETD
jgi:ribonuclease BN (tRNA processing enzyme)